MKTFTLWSKWLKIHSIRSKKSLSSEFTKGTRIVKIQNPHNQTSMVIHTSQSEDLRSQWESQQESQREKRGRRRGRKTQNIKLLTSRAKHMIWLTNSSNADCVTNTLYMSRTIRFVWTKAVRVMQGNNRHKSSAANAKSPWAWKKNRTQKFTVDTAAAASRSNKPWMQQLEVAPGLAAIQVIQELQLKNKRNVCVATGRFRVHNFSARDVTFGFDKFYIIFKSCR